jgi:hypothetical protein
MLARKIREARLASPARGPCALADKSAPSAHFARFRLAIVHLHGLDFHLPQGLRNLRITWLRRSEDRQTLAEDVTPDATGRSSEISRAPRVRSGFLHLIRSWSRHGG